MVCVYPPFGWTHKLYVVLPRFGNAYLPSASVVAEAKTWPFHHSSTVHPSSPISPANGSRRPLPSRSSNTMPFAKLIPVGGLSGGGGGTGAGGGGGGGGTGAGGGGGGGG